MIAFTSFLLSAPILLLVNAYLKRRHAEFDPTGKTIVITGASSGIGECLAKEYAKQGAQLVLCARRLDVLNQVGRSCRELGAKDVVCIAADVSKESDCRRIVETAVTLGGIDLLVLNAGISMAERVINLKEDTDSIRKIFETNVFGCMYLTAYALPHLLSGRICVISSLLGLVAGPSRSVYASSKFALKGFFDSLRAEHPEIPITLCYPGFVKTDINRTRLGSETVDFSKANAMSVSEATDIIQLAVRDAVSDEVFTFTGKFLFWARDWVPEIRDLMLRRNLERAQQKKTE